MDHLAIMSSRKLIEKILRREKSIESRWYRTRRTPWQNANLGDMIYFKEQGKPVTARAEILNIQYHECTREQEIAELFMKWQRELGVPPTYLEHISPQARYVTLLWLTNPRQIEPFDIDKQGYGSGAAWITLPTIETIRRR